jgi:predicted nuclease with TOPRIM domain
VKGTNITRISICWDVIFKCIVLYSAKQEPDSLLRSQEAETAKYKTMLKEAEVKISSLEEKLEQKVKNDQELVSICDELINRYISQEAEIAEYKAMFKEAEVEISSLNEMLEHKVKENQQLVSICDEFKKIYSSE